MNDDFKKSISIDWDWKEVRYQLNAGIDKQTLTAYFHNAYTYVKQKLERYVKSTGEIPQAAIDDLIWEFREIFSESGRVPGVKYYDDLLLHLLAKHKEPDGKKESFLYLVKNFPSFIGENPWGFDFIRLKDERYYYEGKLIAAANLIFEQIKRDNFKTDDVKEISTGFHEYFNIGKRFTAKSLWETISRLKKESNEIKRQ